MNVRTVIEIVDLWKAFGDTPVLCGVELSVMDGETLVVLGPSGCGKSVLLKHVIGLLKPDRGSILVGGKDITNASGAELNEIRKSFGMVFQGAALFDSMTVGENVGLPLREHRRLQGAELERLVEANLALVGLEGISDLRPSEISGGMKKRVALARAIALDPDIILYDEPTTGLDPLNANVINRLIARLQGDIGRTSVIVTHDVESAFYLGDQIALLSDGRVRALGTPEELKNSPDEGVQNFLHPKIDEALDS